MNWERAFWIVAVLAFFVIGLYLGFVLHESLMIKGAIMIAEGLEGTNFNLDIDFNETEITNRVIKFFNESGLASGKIVKEK